MGTKPWYASRGAWGNLGTLVVLLLLVGGRFMPEPAQLTQEQATEAGNLVVDLAYAGGALVAWVLAWVGRWGAKQPLAIS